MTTDTDDELSVGYCSGWLADGTAPVPPSAVAAMAFEDVRERREDAQRAELLEDRTERLESLAKLAGRDGDGLALADVFDRARRSGDAEDRQAERRELLATDVEEKLERSSTAAFLQSAHHARKLATHEAASEGVEALARAQRARDERRGSDPFYTTNSPAAVAWARAFGGRR
jgi:hypothetical protein